MLFRFSLKDVEVITAVVDLDEVRSYRSTKSRAMQARETPSYHRVPLDFSLSTRPEIFDSTVAPSPEIQPSYHKPEEEIELGPACFLWDYIRRSRQAGYFIPLSGGVDSCATSCIVFSMCKLVFAEVQKADNPEVLKDLLRTIGEDADSKWRPQTPQDIAGRLFVSAYMGMEKNSSADTRTRARELARDIGSYVLTCKILHLLCSTASAPCITFNSLRYIAWSHLNATQNCRNRFTNIFRSQISL